MSCYVSVHRGLCDLNVARILAAVRDTDLAIGFRRRRKLTSLLISFRLGCLFRESKSAHLASEAVGMAQTVGVCLGSGEPRTPMNWLVPVVSVLVGGM